MQQGCTVCGVCCAKTPPSFQTVKRDTCGEPRAKPYREIQKRRPPETAPQGERGSLMRKNPHVGCRDTSSPWLTCGVPAQYVSTTPRGSVARAPLGAARAPRGSLGRLARRRGVVVVAPLVPRLAERKGHVLVPARASSIACVRSHGLSRAASSRARSYCCGGGWASVHART